MSFARRTHTKVRGAKWKESVGRAWWGFGARRAGVETHLFADARSVHFYPRCSTSDAGWGSNPQCSCGTILFWRGGGGGLGSPYIFSYALQIVSNPISAVWNRFILESCYLPGARASWSFGEWPIFNDGGLGFLSPPPLAPGLMEQQQRRVEETMVPCCCPPCRRSDIYLDY